MPELPTREELESLMGDKSVEEWAGQCHAAATAVQDAMGAEHASVRRGYYIGEIASESYFAGLMWHEQHSWVELRDGTIVDPTRFAFTAGPVWPLWTGSDEDYDVGGCKRTPPAGNPPGPYDSEKDPVELELGSVEYLVDLLGLPSEYYGDDWVTLTVEQLGWLANLPIRERREEQGTLSSFFAAEVYEAIIESGYGALIPIDRRDWILPDSSEGRVKF